MGFRCPKTAVLPEEPSNLDLNINIKSFYNSKPLIINQINDYNGKKIRFTRLSFFVTSPRATTSGKTVQFSNSTFLSNFTAEDSLKANQNIRLSFNAIAGNYTAIDFGIGVPTADNAKQPKDFSSTDDLADAGNYWDAWNSYIFIKLEGLLDKDGDGRFETGVTLHAGGNELYKQLKYDKTFGIGQGSPTYLNFELDINKLVNGIDLTTYNSSHQVGDIATMRIMMNNLNTAMTLKN